MTINDTSNEPAGEPASEPPPDQESSEPLSPEVPSEPPPAEPVSELPPDEVVPSEPPPAGPPGAPPPAEVVPGEPAEGTVTVIGFGRRLVAYFIDAFILWAVGLCLGLGALALTASGPSEYGPGGPRTVAQCLSTLIGLAYFVIFWATSGQTPGKMALGIKVISVDGTSVGWGKAILRYIGYIISVIVLFLGFIWIAFDSKRQGWHDKIAKTLVVHKDTQFSATEPVTFVPSDQGSSAAVILAVLVFVVLILVPIVTIAILLLLGPVIGNVFSNIVENL